MVQFLSISALHTAYAMQKRNAYIKHHHICGNRGVKHMAKPIKIRHEPKTMENTTQIQSQIIRGLRYFIVLNILKTQPMHGYGIITIIRKNFGIYLGPSSVYPLLNDLEDWKYVDSVWETEKFHPKRIYKLTVQGHNLLNYLECTFGPMLMGIGTSSNT
ncbi:MAG: hypothetical protein CW691_03340 [Candidatus Bathyarchaeum sp.]|nr:MAG: hypothetical protein CW691_03340 [Candidatus Bathyarchaeum sp.]